MTLVELPLRSRAPETDVVEQQESVQEKSVQLSWPVHLTQELTKNPVIGALSGKREKGHSDRDEPEYLSGHSVDAENISCLPFWLVNIFCSM